MQRVRKRAKGCELVISGTLRASACRWTWLKAVNGHMATSHAYQLSCRVTYPMLVVSEGAEVMRPKSLFFLSLPVHAVEVFAERFDHS